MTGKWKVKKNYGGAYICLDGMEIAHVGNTFSTRMMDSQIPLDGMERAKWLCGLLNQNQTGEDNPNEN